MLNTTNVVVCDVGAGSAIKTPIFDVFTTLHHLLVTSKHSHSWKHLFLELLSQSLVYFNWFTLSWARNLLIMRCVTKRGTCCSDIRTTDARTNEQCYSTAFPTPDIPVHHILRAKYECLVFCAPNTSISFIVDSLVNLFCAQLVKLLTQLKTHEIDKNFNKALTEAEVEEEKRELITREIGKFREIMKVST